MPVKTEFSNVFPARNKIQDELLIYIHEHGGRVRAASVYKPLADIFHLSPQARNLTREEYYIRDSKPGLAWDNVVQWAVSGLRENGYLLPASAGRGFWSLSAEGARHVDAKRRSR